MGGGAARGTRDVSQIPGHFRKPFPGRRGGGPGSSVTSSCQAGDGDRDGDTLCCPGRNRRRVGSRAVPDCPEQPRGQWDLSVTDPFSFAHPMWSQQTGTPRVGEDRDPIDPAILSAQGLGFGCFFPVFWSDSAPATSVPQEGPSHTTMHTPRPTTPGEAMEPEG